jgi:hypothetical protein
MVSITKSGISKNCSALNAKPLNLTSKTKTTSKRSKISFGDSPVRNANFEIVPDESTDQELVIRDLGGKDFPSVTNAAEQVIENLTKYGHLTENRRLFYYDSTNRLDELLHDGQGTFVGFAPGRR